MVSVVMCVDVVAHVLVLSGRVYRPSLRLVINFLSINESKRKAFAFSQKKIVY